MVSNHFTHDCTLVLYKQLIHTGSVLLLLPFSSVLGFPLYEDTGDGRAVTHQLYSFAIEVWYAPMARCLPAFSSGESLSEFSARSLYWAQWKVATGFTAVR